jgi:hypothetical protein
VSKARAEAERRAREEVETRIAAERHAREEAEARALAAREDAERKAQAELAERIDAERKAREEAERKREVAEAQAKAALEISATAEKLVREAASKETAVAEKSRDEAHKMRDEAQRLLETARLQHEQAVAKAQAEMTARAHAEQKAVAEKRARAAAEDRAKQEAVARVMQEHQMRQNAEKEIAAKVEAEIKARSQAEFDAEVKARTDAQQRADMVAAQISLEHEDAAVRGRKVSPARKRIRWGRTAAISVAVLLVLAVGFIQIMPMTGYIPAIEKLLSERLQEPVSIGGLRFTLFPAPELKVERIAIGPGQDVRIESALIPMSTAALFDDKKDFDEIEVKGLTFDQDAIPRVAGWTSAPAKSRLQVRRLKIIGFQLALHGIELPSLDGTVTLAKDGGWQKISLRDPKMNLDFMPLKEQGQYRATFHARNWTPPICPSVEFAELGATATVTRDQATIIGIEGRIFEGALKGAVNVRWKNNLSADGELALKGADLASALAGFTRDYTASGTLDAGLKFTSQGQTAPELFAAPRVTATFALQKGTLNNVDLVRAIQSTSRGGLRGGKTPYVEITGEAQSSANRIGYRNLRLAAGPLNATGAFDVSPASQLAGRLNVQLGTQSTSIARGALNVSGGMKEPVLSP